MRFERFLLCAGPVAFPIERSSEDHGLEQVARLDGVAAPDGRDADVADGVVGDLVVGGVELLVRPEVDGFALAVEERDARWEERPEGEVVAHGSACGCRGQRNLSPSRRQR